MTDWSSPQLIAELTALWNSGATVSKIANHLNLTKGQVTGKVARLGLKARPSCIRPRANNTPGTLGQIELAPARKVRISNGVNRPHVPLIAYNGKPGHGCKWPHEDFRERIRDGREPFCDQPTRDGESWCAEHQRRVYVRV